MTDQTKAYSGLGVTRLPNGDAATFCGMGERHG